MTQVPGREREPVDIRRGRNSEVGKARRTPANGGMFVLRDDGGLPGQADRVRGPRSGDLCGR